jgi:single-stranded DNA-binding protein
MNEVFLIGKIISNIEFKFIINSKNKAIACFEIETNDKQIVRIQAYNQLADFVYSKLNKNNQVFINGYIENNVVKVKCINIY